jgi:protein-S-isoprenylcysteine O-methyltransferase Ste14
MTTVLSLSGRVGQQAHRAEPTKRKEMKTANIVIVVGFLLSLSCGVVSIVLWHHGYHTVSAIVFLLMFMMWILLYINRKFSYTPGKPGRIRKQVEIESDKEQPNKS